MPRLYRKIKAVGLPPGTFQRAEGLPDAVSIHVFDYGPDGCVEKEVKSIEEVFSLRDTNTISWINIDSPTIPTIESIQEHFGIHPLVLEDIVNLGQRPKLEDYGDYMFVVARMIYFEKEEGDIHSEQISLILGKNYVISFQETHGDVFDPIRKRLREGKGLLRKSGSDYLAYAILDILVDNYFLILEKFGEDLDVFEEELMNKIDPNMPREIHQIKRQFIFLRKNIWPLREVISGMERNEGQLIHHNSKIFLRDVYDHTIQVIDTIEALRDAVSGLHDIYLSSVSNKMNEIMKVLTIFAAIFIPLTFVAGIYGMNFEYMPELAFKGGYFIALGVMFSLGVGMLLYFKKRDWI